MNIKFFNNLSNYVVEITDEERLAISEFIESALNWLSTRDRPDDIKYLIPMGITNDKIIKYLQKILAGEAFMATIRCRSTITMLTGLIRYARRNHNKT